MSRRPSVPQPPRALLHWHRLVQKALIPVAVDLLVMLRQVAPIRSNPGLDKLMKHPKMQEATNDAEREEKLIASLDRPPPSLSTARKEELQTMVKELGGEPSGMTVPELREYARQLRCDEQRTTKSTLPGLNKLKKADLVQLAQTQQIDVEGMTADQIRLALRGWTPPNP